MNASQDTTHQDPNQSGDYFATTRWSLVLAAGTDSPDESAGLALEELCRLYWYPLYAYIRHRGYTKEDAEDLTQAFFVRLLKKNYLRQISQEKGKFRSFLLIALKHFLANEWDRTNCQKRGGGAFALPMDWQAAENRYQIDPPDYLSPDKLYDRAWAMTMLERVVQQLEREIRDENKAEMFFTLKPLLMLEQTAIPYQQAAETLHLSEGTLRVVVHRWRRRYRELLRQEIAQTVSDAHAVQEEIQALFAAFEG